MPTWQKGLMYNQLKRSYGIPQERLIKNFLQSGTIIVLNERFRFFSDPERRERHAFREFCPANPADFPAFRSNERDKIISTIWAPRSSPWLVLTMKLHRPRGNMEALA